MSGVSTTHIFISYSRTDGTFVDRLQADLLARNFDAWVDRKKLEGGQTWEKEIQAGLDRSSVVVVVISPDAAASPWVETEYTYALRKQKRIIPLLLHGNDDTVPFALSRIQYIDFRPGYGQGFEQLLIALTALSISTASPAEVSEDVGVVQLPQQRDLDELYREGRKAQTMGDLDRAYILWKQVLDTQPNYGAGSLVQDMQDVERQLRPIRIRRLQEQADAARRNGETGQLIGALEALVSMDSQDTRAGAELRGLLDSRAESARAEGRWDDEIEARQALLRLNPRGEQIANEIAIAEQNKKCAWRYANVRQFAAEGELPAAKVEMERLWREAPFYGDPNGLAPKLGLIVGETYRAKIAREERERAAREEAQRKADQERLAREAAARSAAEAERQAAERERQLTYERQRAEAEAREREAAWHAAEEARQHKLKDVRWRAAIALLALPGVVLSLYGPHFFRFGPFFEHLDTSDAWVNILVPILILLIFCGPSVIALVRALYFKRPGWASLLVVGGLLFVVEGLLPIYTIFGVPVSLVPPITALIFAFFGPSRRK